MAEEKHEIYDDFWEIWLVAGELEKLTLLTERPIFKYHYGCASICNGYLVDLVEYLKRNEINRKE